MTEPKNTVVFDLETMNTFQELGMHKNKDKNPEKLRMAIGGVLYEETHPGGIKFEVHKFFGEEYVEHLFEILDKADLIVGHNLCKFDYKVLQQYHKENVIKRYYDKTFDTMLKLLPFTDNCWTGLDDLAQLNLGMCKPHSGEKIPQMWRNNQIREVTEYLLNDLKMTRDIYLYIKKNGKVKYTHKDYGTIIGEREVIVKW